MPNKHQHLIEAYRRLRERGEDAVLATVVETFGSTYQKAGARMVIERSGAMDGLLGGGCFERDLLEQAESVFETGIAKCLFYDMRGAADDVWGLGMGCDGAVRILLQRLAAGENFHPLDRIAEAALAHASGVMVTVLTSDHPQYPAGYCQFLTEPDAGQPPGLAGVPMPFVTSALQSLLQQTPRTTEHRIDSATVRVFYDAVQPPWRLLVIGGGDDVAPLVQCAKLLGWRVTVVDYRPAYVRPERFASADDVCLLPPEQLAGHLDLSQFKALVLMTHNIDYDSRYLAALRGSRIRFIGLLGPARRRDRLLRHLGDDAEHLAYRVFGPVGLDIGAETPAEIAVSIMAGIHAELTGRRGQILAAKVGNGGVSRQTDSMVH